MFPELNLPKTKFNINSTEKGYNIWCITRKKYVFLTPEEWVRQNIIHFLVNKKKFPLSWMSCESSIRTQNNIKKRYDVLVYNKDFSANTLIECKAYKISLKQEHINQIIQYNRVLNASTLILSNGIQHEIIKIDYVKNSFSRYNDFPSWEEIKKE